jgi:hypothetical protein
MKTTNKETKNKGIFIIPEIYKALYFIESKILIPEIDNNLIEYYFYKKQRSIFYQNFADLMN